MSFQYRRDFGSFHVSNVQELLSLPEDVYTAPKVPFPLPNFSEYSTNGPPQFGRDIRDKHFLLEDCIFINHGAFGAALKDGIEVAQAWQIYIEKQPTRFIDRELFPHLVHATRRLAQYVGCDPLDLVLVQNVTTALSAILLSQFLQGGDVVYCFNTVYGAVKKMLNHIAITKGVIIQEEIMPFPVTDHSEIVEFLKKTLKENTRLAIFDHIPSNVPIIMPLQEMIEICHERNVCVLVDGAHALGVLPIDLSSLKADFYVSNGHKWLCCTKGCGFLYTKKFQKQIHSQLISHGFGSGFSSEFLWTGLRDYSALLSLGVNIDFWNSLGQEAVFNYSHGLLKSAVNVLQMSWRTESVTSIDNFGFMALICLPDELYKNKHKLSYADAEEIQNKLYHKANIEVPVKLINNRLYVRISCHIYNELWEYWKLAKTMKEIISEMMGLEEIQKQTEGNEKQKEENQEPMKEIQEQIKENQEPIKENQEQMKEKIKDNHEQIKENHEQIKENQEQTKDNQEQTKENQDQIKENQEQIKENQEEMKEIQEQMKENQEHIEDKSQNDNLSNHNDSNNDELNVNVNNEVSQPTNQI